MSVLDLVPVGVASTEQLFKALKYKANFDKEEIPRKRQLKDSFKSQYDLKRKELQGEIDDLQKKEKELKESQKSYQYDEEKIKKIRIQRGLIRGKDAEDLKEIYYDMVMMIIQKKFKDYLRSLLQIDETEMVLNPPLNEKAAKEQYKIYGLLISACKVKTMEYTDFGPVKEKCRDQSDATNAAIIDSEKEVYHENKEEAKRLTFEMLKLLPPLVVCQPKAYNEDVQDTNRMTWDEEQKGAAVLHYYRPLLIYGNHLHVAVKGLVGNSWVIKRGSIILKKELDSGSFGKVCVAMYQNTEVAAKCLHEILLSDYNVSVFIRELGISSRLRHPNIVRFIGATRDEHPIIILYELMSTSLHKEIQKNRLTTNQVTKVSLDVCAALDYLHHFRPDPILHRDVSSPNVLLNISTEHWIAKLSDLGSANFIHQVSLKSTHPGNPFYAAPESYNPEEQSPAMDVYSFGVLLMEMNLRKPPAGSARDRTIQATTITSPLFKGIVEQCLQREKAKRPQISDIIKKLSQ